MKLKKLLLGALPLALFAACSNDNDPNTNVMPEQKPDGYIAVNLQLPTTSATRAANDNFDHGEASEYSVNEGIIVFFKGTDEATATYCGAYDLGFPRTPTGENDQENNVTVSYKRAVKVSGIALEANENLYGLVMLNQSQAGVVLSTNGLTVGANPCTSTTTFTNLLSWTSELPLYNGEAGKAASSIFMCNSPLSDKSSSQVSSLGDSESVKVTTLVDLKPGLKATEEEALNAPAGTIYVERAVAKITCSKFTNDINSGITIGEGDKAQTLYIKNVEWALGNEEPSSFFVRNVDGIDWTLNSKNIKGSSSSPYRMVGEKSLKQNIDDPSNNNLLYRPYWCKDPNYDQDKGNPDKLGEMLTWNKDQILYTHENTFDVKRQQHKNTTRIGFWVTFAVGENANASTFYIRNNTRTILFFDKDGKNPLLQNVIADLAENEAVKAAWNAALKNQAGSGSADFEPADLLTIETEISPAGLLSVKSIAFKDNADLYTATPSFDFTTLISSFNQTYQFYEYKDGKAFYEVRIKHFGDDLTPWESDKAVSDTAGAYPDADGNRDNNYLGRYGMVRNNWYDIQINNLVNLGDPRDPATWDTSWNDRPDDNKDLHVAFTIAVLSWAKRFQNHDF